MNQLCDNLEVWDRVGGSRGRRHMYTYGLSMVMYDRNQHNIVTILQLKINKLKKYTRVCVCVYIYINVYVYDLFILSVE